MELHSLYNEPGSRTSRKRKGRGHGSGLGKTAGRGHKGQYARSGHKHKDHFEGGQTPLLRRLPKRGFKNPVRISYEPVNVGQLALFEAGSVVDVAALVKAGIISTPTVRVKLLGVGEVKQNLVVKLAACSAAAREKIIAAGGTCEVE